MFWNITQHERHHFHKQFHYWILPTAIPSPINAKKKILSLIELLLAVYDANDAWSDWKTRIKLTHMHFTMILFRFNNFKCFIVFPFYDFCVCYNFARSFLAELRKFYENLFIVSFCDILWKASLILNWSVKD
jgi:hypothetical protein